MFSDTFHIFHHRCSDTGETHRDCWWWTCRSSYVRVFGCEGLQNVTLLEAEAEVGGKSLTMYDPSQPDVPHELGTCYMSPGYTLIRNLLDEYDKDIVTCNWKILEMM